MLRYVLSGIIRGSTSSLAARTTTAPRRATRFVACEVKTATMGAIGQSFASSVGAPTIAIAIAPEHARLTWRIKHPWSSSPRTRPRALARRPVDASSRRHPPRRRLIRRRPVRERWRARRRTCPRATPSRRQARARVNDKNTTIHIRAPSRIGIRSSPRVRIADRDR